jgi:manganese/iron transport system ATP-binding protein
LTAIRDSAPPAAPPAAHDAGDAIVTCEDLVLGYRGRALLPPFALRLRRGCVWLVVGRNGSGKTTFVRTVLGLLRPVSGQIALAPGLRRAYVPQASAIDGTVPVRGGDVTAWGRIRGWDFMRPWRSKDDLAAVRRALADIDASPQERRRFGEMSGGQQQRVLLAQMLAGDAELAILDEPTAAMDATSERAAYQRLRELVRERKMAAVVVTHAVAVAAPFADHIAFFDPDDRSAGHDGGRVVLGPAAEVAADDRFEDFFGKVHAGTLAEAHRD